MHFRPFPWVWNWCQINNIPPITLPENRLHFLASCLSSWHHIVKEKVSRDLSPTACCPRQWCGPFSIQKLLPSLSTANFCILAFGMPLIYVEHVASDPGVIVPVNWIGHSVPWILALGYFFSFISSYLLRKLLHVCHAASSPCLLTLLPLPECP